MVGLVGARPRIQSLVSREEEEEEEKVMIEVGEEEEEISIFILNYYTKIRGMYVIKTMSIFCLTFQLYKGPHFPKGCFICLRSFAVK